MPRRSGTRYVFLVARTALLLFLAAGSVAANEFGDGASKLVLDNGGGGCGACGPSWGARAGAVALFRDRANSALLVFDQTDPTTNLTAADYDFGYEAGFDVSVMKRLENWPDIELRYLGCDGWNARAGLVTTGTSEINAAVPVTVPGARDVDTVYGSKLDSAELNARMERMQGRLVFLVGFRYLELDEVYQADFVDPTGLNATVAYDVATQNRLYGGQIGAEVKVVSLRKFRLDFSGKAGLFGNLDAQHTLLDNGVITEPAAGNAQTMSVVGEAHLTAVFVLCGDLSLRASYGVMGISDVALATDQIGVTDFLGTRAVHDNGNAFYHGGFLGLGWGY